MGGIAQKRGPVEDSGADLFFVPQRAVEQTRRGGLAVRGVDELEEALDVFAGG